MKAVVIEKTNDQCTVTLRDFLESDLMPGNVTVRVSHSTVNYKDGLAITGKAPVVRRFPMIPGIDLAGTVETSSHPDFKVGDTVILNGWGTGETHLGAYAEISRLNGDWLVPLPDGMTPAQAMAIGTAGYTAMLCVMALEHHGLKPQDGPILVTGAAGGVGSIAIALLAGLGWHVVASTGRPQEAAYLKSLGASEIIERSELAKAGKPLGKERWVGAIDTVGSTTLANALAMTKYGGAVAACGLVGGLDLPASVAPFILRGIALYGIDSVMVPKAKRVAAWQRLAKNIDFTKLREVTQTIGLDEVFGVAEEIVAGKVRGRVVVEIR